MKSPWVTFPETLLVGPDRLHRVADVAGRGGRRSDAEVQAGRHRAVHLRRTTRPTSTSRPSATPTTGTSPTPTWTRSSSARSPTRCNRRDALKSGAVDLIHSDNGEVISGFRDDKDFVQEEISNNSETGYTLLHVTQTLPDGTPSPLTDKRVRCALAYAYDEPTVLETIDQGVFPIANGPFPPGTVGYLEDTGFPQKQDMAKAQALIADYKKDNPGPLNLSLRRHPATRPTSPSPSSRSSGGRKPGSTTSPSTRSTRATTSSPPFWGTSRSSSGATTAASTWTTSTSGGTRPRRPRWASWPSTSAASRTRVIDDLLDKNRAETDPAKKKGYAEEVNKMLRRASATTSGAAGTSGASPTSRRSTGWRTSPCPDGKTSQLRPGHRRRRSTP